MLRPRPDCFRLRARTVLAFTAFIFGVAGAVAPVAAEEGEVAPAVETKTQREHSWYAATIAEDEKGNFLMVHFWAKGALFRSEPSARSRGS